MSSVLIKNYGDTNFITGIRAFAAFAVVLIHAGGGGLREFGVIGNHIVDFGAHGVAVFFVISGYSVAASYITSNGYGDYLNKRLWRIAPLYYFWIGASILAGVTATYWQEQFHTSVNAYNLLMHLSFLSFLDYKIANTILGVEWSIPIEVFWYLLIPFLMKWIVSRKQIVIAIFLAYVSYKLAVKYPAMLPVPTNNAGLAMHWSPIPYALGFFLGIAAFRLRESGINFTRWGNHSFIATMISFIFLIISINPASKSAYIYISILTFVLVLFGSDNSQLFRWIFVNKIVIYLGSISYGIYLCHLPLLNMLVRFNLVNTDGKSSTFLIVSACAILASTLTYFLVERPCQLLGKIFYNKYKHTRSLII